MSKPSRLQHQVEQISKVASSGVSYARLACEKDILKLLKQERRWVVRLVKKERDGLNPTMAAVDWGKGYTAACDDLLRALKEPS